MRKAEEDVANIARLVADNYFDTDVTNTFVGLVIQMTLEQPLKIPFIAAIVLHANTHKPDLALEVLAKAGETTQKYIDTGAWREVKLLLRLFACLQGLFDGDGVFPILEDLFARAVDLQTASSEDALGLELVKVILYTIPYVMASSATGFEAQASGLLDRTDVIASTPHTFENLVDPFYSGDTEDSSTPQSALGLLQKLLQDESTNGWELPCLPRPWKVPTQEGEEDLLPTATKQTLPKIVVPENVPTGPNPIFPQVWLSVYSDQDVETVPPPTDITAFLVRDSLTDTINILDYNRNATARFLIDVDCFFTPNTFVKRGTPFDKLKDIAGDRPTWKPEDVAVDAAFSQLFQLPVAEHKLIYYHSILTEACKLAPAAIAPSLGRAIRYLYRNFDKLDLELAERFLDWFAHHLSNFGFTWKWTEWVDDVQLSEVHPKKAFIVSALDKEIRLSFAQRIKGTLPEPYQALISEEKAKDTPDFKFANEATAFAPEGNQLAALIRSKSSNDEIEPIIQSIEAQAKSMNTIDPLLASTDAFVTAICYIGSKSLSHLLSCIERNKDRLLSIGSQSPAARRQIITSVMDYWRDQPGVGINIVDKLLNYTIINPISVVEWALVYHSSHGTNLSVSHIYEMISSTVGKVTNRVRQIVFAYRRPGLPTEQSVLLQETLEREQKDMRQLFAVIDEALLSITTGSTNQEMQVDDTLNQGDQELLGRWGQRWVRVFSRKLLVEEAWIKEELAKPIPEPEPEVPTKMETEENSGTTTAAVDGEGVNGGIE
ncbi:putative cap binding protein [Phaeomoniella chlamydospora]|uniref:Putative cap binding protein n=1 Tax=Phaeomoniella chlamydospora TaxID=158046 RepID=A0A0G2ETS1_PHACM|nr:putative cap binding protein [Phaeomoniella chlamydospora]